MSEAPTRPWVVLLEDDPSVARVVQAGLAPLGVDILCARRVAELPQGEAADLYILDAELPDGDGFAVCRRLRQKSPTAEIPIIFLTRRDDVGSRVRAFEAGAQDYVIKPFAVEELAARVRAHLRIKSGRDEQRSRIDELSLRLRARQDLADMLVHDLKTPLSTVKMTLALMRETGVISDAQYAGLASSAEGAVDLALLMLNDLLDLGAGQLAVERTPVALAALAQRARAVLEPQAAKRRQRLEISAGPERVLCDEKLLFRVALNLLVNALKFSPPQTRVALSLSAAGGRLTLAVEDSGRGVADEEKSSIFEMYTRGSGAESAPGTGIGLSFCRLAARALGGEMRVEDREGGGSRFVLDVPAAEAEPGAAELFGPELMKEYLDDCAAQLSAAEALCAAPLDAAGRELVRVTAHRLAGSAGTYGFPEVTTAAKALEGSLKAGTPPSADVAAALAVLRRGLGLA